MKSEPGDALTLAQVVHFVSDFEEAVRFYRDTLHFPVIEEREGWMQFDAGAVPIALHRGAGRKPRLDFTTDDDLSLLRDELNEAGAKLAEIRELDGLYYCNGRDPDDRMIRIIGRRSTGS